MNFIQFFSLSFSKRITRRHGAAELFLTKSHLFLPDFLKKQNHQRFADGLLFFFICSVSHAPTIPQISHA